MILLHNFPIVSAKFENKAFTSGALYARLLRQWGQHFKGIVTNVHYVYGQKMDRQTNRNSNSVINDCTYIKTINILNTVSIDKKKEKNLPG